MQITHHLFPRLPRPNLREATERVKTWCHVEGVTFREKGFKDGNGEMVGMLRSVKGQIRIMREAAEEVRSKGGWGEAF